MCIYLATVWCRNEFCFLSVHLLTGLLLSKLQNPVQKALVWFHMSVMGSEITKASQEHSEPRILLRILWFIAHIFQLSGPRWLCRSFFGQPALIKFFQSMPSIFHRNNFAFIFPWLSSILLNHVLTVTDAAGLNTSRNIHNQLSVHRRRGCVTFTGIQDPPGRIRAFLFFFFL